MFLYSGHNAIFERPEVGEQEWQDKPKDVCSPPAKRYNKSRVPWLAEEEGQSLTLEET